MPNPVSETVRPGGAPPRHPSVPARARGRGWPAGALLGCALLVLAACGSTGSTATNASGTTSAAAAAAAELTVSDAWVKSATGGMTAAFATLTNTTDHEVTVTGARTPASRTVELHEVVTVNGVSRMQPKHGGFAIAAHASHTLAPGGDHIMLMALTGPIAAGDTVDFTLDLSGGTTVGFSAVAKDFSGANETYAPSGGASGGAGGGGDMSGMPATSGSATP